MKRAFSIEQTLSFLILGAFAALSFIVSACGNSGGGGSSPSPSPTVITTGSTCQAGQVLTTQGCQQTCPTNPACGSANGGYCNVPAVVNTAGTTACTVPGQVPTVQGCLVQCQGTNFAGPSCNIPISTGATAATTCNGSYYGYGNGYGNGYSYGGYSGYSYGSWNSYNQNYGFIPTPVYPYNSYYPYYGGARASAYGNFYIGTPNIY